MEKRRVTSVIESLRRGGAERLLVTLHEHLDRERFEPSVISLFGPNPLAEELTGIGVPVQEMGFGGPGELLRGLARLRRELRALRPDVVHTHLYYANVAGRLASLGTGASVITTLHNPDYTYEDPGSRRFQVKKWVDRKTGHWINAAFTAVSNEVAWDYERHMGFKDIRTIPNFMDVRAFQNRLEALDRAQTREDLGIDPGQLVLLHVGRLHRQKGQDVLPETLALVRDAGVDAVLFLVGEGSDEEELRRSARSHGVEEHVHFAGSRADVAPYLRAGDIFVFPSRWEAFGIALLEAMAAGLPAIVSQVGGLTEVATEDTARFVLIRDPRPMSQAVLELHGDPDRRARMAEAARARAGDFDVAVHLPEIEALYERV